MSYSPPPGGPSEPEQWRQPYGGYPPYGQQPPSQKTNLFAILSLVFAFVFAPAGIVLGHLAKRQIRTSGEQGGQIATWGLALSYIFTALYLIACCGVGALIWLGRDGAGSYSAGPWEPGR